MSAFTPEAERRATVEREISPEATRPAIVFSGPDVLDVAGLRVRREGRRESLEDVAAAVGITPGHLSRLERGERRPSRLALIALAAHFNIGPEQLEAELPGD